ncbi:unnamed protein product [Heterobilharzia americana]|nr:unnamed protein product [Heterobilharzia americana]
MMSLVLQSCRPRIASIGHEASLRRFSTSLTVSRKIYWNDRCDPNELFPSSAMKMSIYFLSEHKAVRNLYQTLQNFKFGEV